MIQHPVCSGKMALTKTLYCKGKTAWTKTLYSEGKMTWTKTYFLLLEEKNPKGTDTVNCLTQFAKKCFPWYLWYSNLDLVYMQISYQNFHFIYYIYHFLCKVILSNSYTCTYTYTCIISKILLINTTSHLAKF